MTGAVIRHDIRCEPEEQCSVWAAVGIGVQGVMLIVGPVVVYVATVVRAAERSDSYLSWAVFSSMAICGITTVLQAARFGRLGAGHVLITGPCTIFLAICITALTEGGPATMASLVVVSSFLQFGLAAALPLLRRIITPVVMGVVMMLIAYSVALIGFDALGDAPDSSPTVAGPLVAAVTLAVAAATALRSSARWRLWAPILGIAPGLAVAALFGLYNVEGVAEAPWIDVPRGGWPGLDLTPGIEFWALLPMFVIATSILAIRSVSDGIVVQAVARREPRATDFRVAQGALNANGAGMLMSGLAGTLPTMGYPAHSTSIVTLSGLASRRVGYAVGSILVLLAFLPKFTAVLLAIPGPVVGAWITFLMAQLFVTGMRLVFREGLDARSGAIAGLAFWLGVGAENQAVFSDRSSGGWAVLFGSGITVGALAAIVMVSLVNATRPRGSRLEATLAMSALPEIDGELVRLASRIGWDAASTGRLRSAAEETLASLLQLYENREGGGAPRLIVIVRPDAGAVEMEFMAVFDEENLENRLAYLSEQAEKATFDERELSLRLLRHHSASVRHRKYHGVDIVVVKVEGSA